MCRTDPAGIHPWTPLPPFIILSGKIQVRT